MYLLCKTQGNSSPPSLPPFVQLYKTTLPSPLTPTSTKSPWTPHYSLTLARISTNSETDSAISVDIATDYIYWTDKLESKIYQAPLNGKGAPKVFISTNLVTPEDVVVDWIGRTLYWADSGTGRIEVADLEGGARRVIVQGLVQVLGLALDIRTR